VALDEAQQAGMAPVPGSASDQGSSAVETTNDNLLNQQLSQVLTTLTSTSATWVTKLTDIATAITASLIGGVTGSVANAVLVAKGTSGRALQPTNTTLDPSTGAATFPSGGAVQTGTGAGNTLLLRAYDVDGTSYTTFGTLTANDTPTFDLAAATTKGGAAIAVVTQTFFWSWYFPNGTNKGYKLIVNSPVGATITAITTICESGTATLTGSINATPLGGTANSVSTSEQTQAHASANVLAAGDDFTLTLSSVSSLVGMTVTAAITVTLSP
jgi:hypothetical protein